MVLKKAPLLSMIITIMYSGTKPIFRKDAAKSVKWRYVESSGRLFVTWEPEKMVKNGRNLDRNKLRIQIKTSQEEDYVNFTTKPKMSHRKYQHSVFNSPVPFVCPHTIFCDKQIWHGTLGLHYSLQSKRCHDFNSITIY